MLDWYGAGPSRVRWGAVDQAALVPMVRGRTSFSRAAQNNAALT